MSTSSVDDDTEVGQTVHPAATQKIVPREDPEERGRKLGGESPLKPDAKSTGNEVRIVAFVLYPSLRADLEFKRSREVTMRALVKLQRQFDEVFPKTDDEFPTMTTYEQIATLVDAVMDNGDLFKAIRFMWKYVREVDAYRRRIGGHRSACDRAMIRIILYLKRNLQSFTKKNLDRWEPAEEEIR